MGGLKQRQFLCFFGTHGGWESKIKVSGGLVAEETSLPGLQMAASLLGPHMTFPLCVHPRRLSLLL